MEMMWTAIALFSMAIVIAYSWKTQDKSPQNARNTQPRIIKRISKLSKRGCEWKKQQARENIRLLSLSHRVGVFRSYPPRPFFHGADDDAYRKD